MKVQNLEELLGGSPAYAYSLSEVEELNGGALNGLHEASVIDGGSNAIEDLLAELLLAGEQGPHADLRGPYPSPDLGLQLLPLQPLDIADAQLLDPQPPETGVYGRFSHAAVDLNALAEVPGGDHPLRDAAEVVDGFGGYQIDLADAAG